MELSSDMSGLKLASKKLLTKLQETDLSVLELDSDDILSTLNICRKILELVEPPEGGNRSYIHAAT